MRVDLKRKRKRKWTRLALPVATAANLAFLIGAYCFIARSPGGSGLAFGAACVPFVLGIPLVPLMIWSLITRRWWMVGLNVVATIFACVALLGANVPMHRAESSTGPTVRVLTFNIHQGAYGLRSLVEVIGAAKPDVICLQEVNPTDRRGDCVDALARFLGGKWEIQRFADCATLSRLPVTKWTRYNLPLHTGRGIVETTLSVNGRAFTVLNTHLSFNSSDRPAPYGESKLGKMARIELIISEQLEFVMDTAAATRTPVIIAGDFNMPPLCAPYRRMCSGYTDAFKAAGWGMGFTFTAKRPYQRIDYIFTDRLSRVSACYVPAKEASDHRPVVAEIAIGP